MNNVTCIVCPVGCRISVQKSKQGYIVDGAGCERGKNYAINEVISPKRIVTSVISVQGRSGVLSVKSASAIPKKDISKALATIKRLSAQPPIRIGDVICEDLGGTGIALVATKNIY